MKIDVKAFDSALQVIVSSEAAIRDALNEWGPKVVQAVIEGDNIVHVNRLSGAFTGIRKARVQSILKGFVPYDFDKETDQFTTKTKNKRLGEKRVAAFAEFMAGNGTFWELLDQKKQADKKPVDNLKRFEKAAAACLEEGFELDQLLSLLKVAAMKAAPAEKPEAGEVAEAA